MLEADGLERADKAKTDGDMNCNRCGVCRVAHNAEYLTEAECLCLRDEAREQKPTDSLAVEFGRDPLALFQRVRGHGEVVRIRFGPFSIYVLNSPAAIRDALVGQARKLEKGLSFGRAKRLIGNGLVMAEGEDHQRQRRLMQPAFHRAEIAGYLGTMREVAVPRISAWRDGETLAFDREMRSITLTVLTRTLLSSDVGSEAIDEIERLLRVLLSELVARGIAANVPGLGWVPTRSNLRFGAARRRLNALLAEIIDGYRATGAEHDGLVSIFMSARDDDTGAGMSARQLRDEATTLVIAGSETTGNTIAWACYLLATHPELQQRLYDEVRQVLAGDGAPGYEALARLPFTRAVITETLRLYSPVWILPRRALADVELGGHLVPKGTRMLFSPYALNRDARLHRDPDRCSAASRRNSLKTSFSKPFCSRAKPPARTSTSPKQCSP